MSRLCVCVALPAEARALIEHWHLRHVPASAAGALRAAGQRLAPSPGMRLYTRDELLLVQTGLGKLRAAAAVAGVLHTQPSVTGVLNVGLAGADYPLGSVLLAHRIDDVGSGRRWYPQLPPLRVTRAYGNTLRCVSVRTLDRPGADYTPGTAVDMEASGVMTAALDRLHLGQVLCIKVVSDNPDHPLVIEPGDNRARFIASLQANAERWIGASLPCVDALSDHLLTLTNTHPLQGELNALHQFLLSQARHSQSEEHQLRRLLERHLALSGELPARQPPQQPTSARAIRTWLENGLERIPLLY